MKAILEKVVQKKSPGFRFDPNLSTAALCSLVMERSWCLLRGLRMLLHGRVPRFLFLGSRVKLFCANRIRFGRFVRIGDGCYLSGLGQEPLEIGDHSSIGAYSRVIITTQFHDVTGGIRIGRNVGIGEFACLGGAGGLDIGDDCISGAYLSCHPENHNFTDPGRPIRLQGVTRKGIKIGNGCWIGAKVTILDGVVIGDHCVIAAGSVVTRSMPAFSVIAGVPAKVLRSTSDQG